MRVQSLSVCRRGAAWHGAACLRARLLHIGHSHDTSALSRAWDFDCGGQFPLQEVLGNPRQALEFFNRHGFVVFTGVMTNRENAGVMTNLLDDLHEINPRTRHIHDLAAFPEAVLPHSPNSAFRTTCNIVFGRFASAVRAHEGVRQAFSVLHKVAPAQLGCSWDSVFYTSHADTVGADAATQLHWDANGYCAGEPHAMADELCVQGVYYAAATDTSTPCFCCVPGSHTSWRAFSESASNPATRAGGSEPLLNYLPVTPFGEDASDWPAPLDAPVRVHVPAGSLLLWNSRTCHGNSPPADNGGRCNGEDSSPGSGPRLGRVSLAISFGPVSQRSAAVQKDALVKALGAVRTTHHPSAMLTHDQQGYPADWVQEAEHEPKHVLHGGDLRDLRVPLNPDLREREFQEMLRRSTTMCDVRRRALQASGLSLENLQQRIYQSYWELRGQTKEDCFIPMTQLDISEIRRLLHPRYSNVQGLHTLHE